MDQPNQPALPPLRASFRHTITNTFGDAGHQWLDDLPSLLAGAAQRWQLVLERPFANLSYNYVTRARDRDGRPVVLKLGVPNPELNSEIAALRLFDGRGAARLLQADAAGGLLLLERLQPGHTLLPSSARDDDQATRLAAQVMQSLHRPAPTQHDFITVAQWGRGFARLRQRFQGGCGPFPAALVARSEAIYNDYLAAPQTAVVLHGDLHHENILASGPQQWLAIDPKGVVGEAAYETGALLRNALPPASQQPRLDVLTARRAAILAEMLDLDRERILNWGFAQAILSAWWSYEDGDPDWQAILPLAEQMETLLN